MPETGYKIADKITKNVYKIEELEDAVAKAKEVTKKGYICLLSPSASSYNKFKNFLLMLSVEFFDIDVVEFSLRFKDFL